MFHKVNFKTKDGCTHIWIDDKEIQGCISASFSYEVNAVPVVKLEFFASEVEIETEDANVYRISEEPIDSLGLRQLTENILKHGVWYNRKGEMLKDPVLTVGKLLDEFNGGRLPKYKGLGPSRLSEIVRHLKERGLI